jgi:hypothetical protein
MRPVFLSNGVRCSLLFAAGLSVSLALLAGFKNLVADESSAKSGADQAQAEILKQMLGRVQNMQVRFPAGDQARPAELHPTPLIHYSDQIRSLPESTLWVWQLDQAPVLFCKVERIVSKQDGHVNWQYCCVPATEDKADVTWKRDLRWRAKEVGFKWISAADKTLPHQQEGIRLTQLKGVARGFTGEISGPTDTGRQQSRLLPRPLHRFTAPKANVLDGAVFGLTSNGTNPDVLVIVEALQNPVADSYWRYAVIGMTGDAVDVRFKDKSIWNKTYTPGPGDHKSWMWYVSAQ